MLAGKTVFIVETEFLISLSIQELLQTQGAGEILIATGPDDFHHRGWTWQDAALAILEIETRRSDQLALVRSAREAGIPVLGITADSQLENGLREFPGMPILVKPVLDEVLIAALTRF